ncbi:hypothetical protein LCGC14_2333510 [marine sediment metagenome]|uniref:Rhodanese domain-containing protein n=1 Tax=marine sediment metagenome TaxID=412755 RepID=A0A0F9D1L6_9ZZZZ
MIRIGASMILAAASIAVASPAMSEPAIWSAPEAQAAIADDGALLLDIRTPGEWAQTGLAEGAFPVDMQSADFGAQLSAVFERAGDRPIALICATGGRTAYVVSVLKRNGIEGVIDVSEGMLGNGRAQGWVARGLPVVTEAEARADYEAFLSKGAD